MAVPRRSRESLLRGLAMSTHISKAVRVVMIAGAACVVAAVLLIGLALVMKPACGCANPDLSPPAVTTTAQTGLVSTPGAVESATPMP